MSLTTRVGLLAGMTALTGVSAAASPTTDVDARIAELEAQVARLQTGQNDWLTEQRAEEIRSLVHDVLADADTRASLLQAGMSAGYDNGYMIGSTDGNFSLRLNGQLQVRHVANFLDAGDDDVDEARRGFENTRTKLMFSGNVGGPEFSYFVEGNFGREGGSFSLEDGYIQWAFADGWNVQAGQRKRPFQREWLVHSSNQLTVERSTLSYLQGAARTQGVFFNWEQDALRATFAYSDGISGGAGGFGGISGAYPGGNTAWSTADTEFAFTARGEYLFSGNWDQFADFTSPQGSEQGVMAGAAFHWENQEYGSTEFTDEVMLLQFTADVSLEMDGWNLFGAFTYSHVENDADGAAEIDSDVIGFVLQGGFYFTPDFEGFARYEYADLDEVTEDDEISIITVGINKYFNDNVKWTTDLGYALEGVGADADITGYRMDVEGEDGQFVIRSQWQLVF